MAACGKRLAVKGAVWRYYFCRRWILRELARGGFRRTCRMEAKPASALNPLSNLK
jgi:hypothetical protein